MITELQYDNRVTRLIEAAILEDLGTGDLTTEAIVASDALGHAEIRIKEPGVVAGLEIAAQTFQLVDSNVTLSALCDDGSKVDAGTVLASVEGTLAGILKGERTALNILQRMSGVATMTRTFVDAVAGTGARITDTRKTPPGLRILDKLAVRLGGGVNHRFGLDDMVLIKDNHIAAAGGMDAAIERCLIYLREGNYDVNVEVETRNLEELNQALRHRGIDRIMLDNYSLSDIARAVAIVDHRVEVEASGNVSLSTVRAIAEAGVDFISVGSLTHSPHSLDISLNILPRSMPPHHSS